MLIPFTLYIDDNFSSGHQTLQEAKNSAAPSISIKLKVQIIISGLDPDVYLNYDYKEKNWISSTSN